MHISQIHTRKTVEPKPKCHHCGEVCNESHIQTDGYVFCCEGCKSVYQILRDNNLCTYYDLNENAGISFKQVNEIKQRSRFDYLDNPRVASELLEFWSQTLARVEFHLPQIHCSSCLWLLEKLHKLNKGVISSRVDFMQKQVAISYNPEQISLRNVVELLTTLGYEPALQLQDLFSKHTSSQKSKGLNRNNASMYLKIGIAGFAFANTMIFSFPEYVASGGELSEPLRRLFGFLSIALALPVLFYSASDFFRSAWQSLKHKHINLDVPIVLGILALFGRSVVEIANGSTSGYLDSFSGLVFLLLCGRLFQQKTFETISFDRDYTSYFPIAVAVKRGREETTIPLSEIEVGERLIISNKELVPTDSVLQSNVGHIDYSFVTGEASPVEVLQGDLIYAGGRVLGKTLELVSTKEVSQSYLTSLWNNEAFTKQEKPALETVAERFGAYFTAFTLALAGIAFFAWLPNVAMAINAATAVLVVACPCAMTLAAPFALGWTLKIFGNAGFYLKNNSVVLELTRINALVFDKTGTLTNTETSQVRYSGETLTAYQQELCAAALKNSRHPLSRGVLNAFAYITADATNLIKNVIEIPARGIRCEIEGHTVVLGTAEFIEESFCKELLFCNSVKMEKNRFLEGGQHHSRGSSVHCAIDGEYKGEFIVQSEYRAGLQGLFAELRNNFDVFLLSGDNNAEEERLRPFFPEHDSMRFYQTPQDKLEAVRDLQEKKLHVMMIGDGLNDAGALKQSNVGIALAEKSAMFSPACDAVLASEHLYRLHDFIKFATLTKRIIIGAFWISVVYNIFGLTFAVMGWLSPLFSAILMPISNATVVGFSTGAVQLASRLYGFSNNKIDSSTKKSTIE